MTVVAKVSRLGTLMAEVKSSSVIYSGSVDFYCIWVSYLILTALCLRRREEVLWWLILLSLVSILPSWLLLLLLGRSTVVVPAGTFRSDWDTSKWDGLRGVWSWLTRIPAPTPVAVGLS